MKNISAEIKDNKLVVTVDLGQTFGPSRSGKTIIIASTEGNARVNTDEPAIYLGMNVYKYAPRG